MYVTQNHLLGWFCGIALAVGAVIPTRATVIYDNGGPDHTNAAFADASFGISEAAEDFTLLTGSNTIGGVNWWGMCTALSPTICPTGDFTLNFYGDNIGAPGTLLFTTNVGNANQTATGTNVLTASGGTFTEYSYSASIPDLILTAGTQYWLGISNDTGGHLWSWELTSDTGDAYQYAGAWISRGYELAFNLTAPATAVPEPGTLALFAPAFAGLALIRRKRRSRPGVISGNH